MAAADNKRKALDIALASILKAHGEGAVMRLGEAKQLNVDVIPTGSLALDIALGVGASRAGGSPRSTDRSRRARPPSASTSWPRPRSAAASLPT